MKIIVVTTKMKVETIKKLEAMGFIVSVRILK